jgi:hypothetical protein
MSSENSSKNYDNDYDDDQEEGIRFFEWVLWIILFISLWCLLYSAGKDVHKWHKQRVAGRGWTKKLDTDTNMLIYEYLNAIELLNVRRVCRNWSKDSQSPQAWKTATLDCFYTEATWKRKRRGKSISYSSFMEHEVFPSVPLLYGIVFRRIFDEVQPHSKLSHLRCIDITGIKVYSDPTLTKAFSLLDNAFALNKIIAPCYSVNELHDSFEKITTLELKGKDIFTSVWLFFCQLMRIRCRIGLEHLHMKDIFVPHLEWNSLMLYHPFPNVVSLECAGFNMENFEQLEQFFVLFPKLKDVTICEMGMFKNIHETILVPFIAKQRPEIQITIHQ